MAFIRNRKGGYHTSNQLLETYREDGRVKQRIIGNLGPFENVPEAIVSWKRHIEGLKRMLAAKEKHLVAAEARVEEWKSEDERRVQSHGRPITALYRRLDGRLQPREISDVIISLEDSGLIEVESVKPGKKGGRPSQIYTKIRQPKK